MTDQRMPKNLREAADRLAAAAEPFTLLVGSRYGIEPLGTRELRAALKAWKQATDD